MIFFNIYLRSLLKKCIFTKNYQTKNKKMKILKSDKKSSVVELTQNQLEIITYHLDMFYNSDINEISKEYNKENIN